MSDCAHAFTDPRRDVCVLCNATASEIAAGRDKPATWDDVDEAYERGVTFGCSFRRRELRLLRRRAFLHGARFVIERLHGQWQHVDLSLLAGRRQ